MATVEERVASGMYMLDIHVPGWREGIDLGRLNTRSCEDCILGQVYGTYSEGLIQLGVWGETHVPHMIHQSMLGFAIDCDEADLDLLIDQWRATAQNRAFARLDAEWRRVLA